MREPRADALARAPRPPARGADRRRYGPLAAVVLIPLAALLMAVVSYVYGIAIPEGRTHAGQLLPPGLHISQVQPVAQTWTQRNAAHWWLLHLDSQSCDRACLEAQAVLQRVVLALGRDAGRVEVRFAPAPSGLPPALTAWLAARKIHLPLVLVVDPLGNLVLAYPANAELGGRVLDDLKRLLKVSGIG